jgi:hypothetical protein
MALDVAAVIAQFGAHYKPGSDNQKNLRNMLYKVVETAQYFSNRPTTDTIWRGNLASLERIVQPFQKAYTPIGDMNFEPNEFSLFKIKIDKEEFPDELESTYLGFLADMEEVDRAKWPFVRWWMEQHIMPKKDEDLEQNEYFGGVYAAPANGVAGAAGTAMNGIRKVIRGYNAAGRLNLKNGPIVMGPVAGDPADYCTQVEEFVEAIPSLFRKKLDFIFMSPENELHYKKGKRKKYNTNYQQASDLLTIEDFSNISVKGLESHSGSNLHWASIPANRIRPTKKAALANTMKVESAKRAVAAYTDWWEALNFEVPEFVFTNDQDLA